MSPERQRLARMLFDEYIAMYASRDARLVDRFSENFSGFAGSSDKLIKTRSEWGDITRLDFAQVPGHIGIEMRDIFPQELGADVLAVTAFCGAAAWCRCLRCAGGGPAHPAGHPGPGPAARGCPPRHRDGELWCGQHGATARATGRRTGTARGPRDVPRQARRAQPHRAGAGALGTLCTNQRAVCISGLGRSAALQILAIATAIAAFCALQPFPIRCAHLPLDSCRGSLEPNGA